MKNKTKFLTILIAMFLFSSLVYSQESQCKCGEQCKCDENCKCGERNGTGICHCGPQCTCKYPKASVCKCGSDCQCKANNPDSKCLCGTGCQCGINHSMHQMTHENAFLKMMDSMMTAMDAAPLDTSTQGNFLRQMIPHHQGAIEMAQYEIANGKNREMIQLAKSILTEQQGEIAEMNALLALYPLKRGEPVHAKYKKAMDDAMMKMMMTGPSDKDLEGKNIDCAFAMVMLPHHQAAVDMATVLLKLSPEGQIATYAARIISDQQIEIQQMNEFINQHCK